MSAWGIVLAAGGAARFGRSKQFALLRGVPLVTWSARVVAAVSDGLVVVLPEDRGQTETEGATVVTGGRTRAESVRAALRAVPDATEVVVVGDAAHPLASPALYESVLAAVRGGAPAAVPTLPVAEAVVRQADDAVVDALGREGLAQVQMPQAFRAATLRAAHEGLAEAVDDSALVHARGERVVTVPGEVTNLHVTTREELRVAEALAGDPPPVAGR